MSTTTLPLTTVRVKRLTSKTIKTLTRDGVTGLPDRPTGEHVEVWCRGRVISVCRVAVGAECVSRCLWRDTDVPAHTITRAVNAAVTLMGAAPQNAGVQALQQAAAA